MARLTKIKAAEAADREAKEAAQLEALTGLGLVKGEKIRFRHKDGGTWQYGKVLGVERDGSLGLVAKGSLRSIPVRVCQHQVEGPRGGKSWEDIA